MLGNLGRLIKVAPYREGLTWYVVGEVCESVDAVGCECAVLYDHMNRKECDDRTPPESQLLMLSSIEDGEKKDTTD